LLVISLEPDDPDKGSDEQVDDDNMANDIEQLLVDEAKEEEEERAELVRAVGLLLDIPVDCLTVDGNVVTVLVGFSDEKLLSFDITPVAARWRFIDDELFSLSTFVIMG